MSNIDIYRVCPHCKEKKGLPTSPYWNDELDCWEAVIICENCGYRWEELIITEEDDDSLNW